MALGPKGAALGWAPFVQNAIRSEARRGLESWRAQQNELAGRANGPEPPFTHDRTPRIGILLTNLGTPDAPTTEGGTPLSRAVPVRFARGRDLAVGVEAAPARRDPQHASREVGAANTGDLDQGRLAASRAQPAPAHAPPGLSRATAEAGRFPGRSLSGRARHALRQSRASALRSTSCAPRIARRSWCCRFFRSTRRARRRRRSTRWPRILRRYGGCPALRFVESFHARRGLHPGAGAERQRLLDEARPAGEARAVVSRPAPAHARSRRPVSLLLPGRPRGCSRASSGCRPRSGRSRSSRASDARSG